MTDPKAGGNPENPWDSEDPAFERVLYDEWHGSEQRGMAGMTLREQDELRLMSGCSKERKEIMERRRADTNQHMRESFLLLYGSRKERKAIKERRKAREQAKKQSK
jgi:hypothetical protein